LRAMISEFLFFMSIASICFSGLLFTLWTLGKERWTVKAIAWLMVQIWFGNTYLSFGQASSFHPFFGPILMTIFAAMSNTLLLTILISILSNTVARIDANATQEHLFQYAISTIQGVKADALFSYQPPFNLLAFAILKPASWVVSARALHSANVFLIKMTCFPTLIAIGFYERYFATGQKLRESGKGAAHSLFNSLPRQIKNMPLVEALVGSTSSDLYEAIFDVDMPDDFELFDDSDDDFPELRSFRDTVHTASRARTPSTKRVRKRPASVARSPLRDDPSPRGSPRRRHTSLVTLPSDNAIANSAEVDSGSRSPLARLFGQRLESTPLSAHIEASVKRVETILDDMRDLPVQRLKDEIKELQDRQARIENLLLMLTRGMRNETAPRRETRS